METTKMGYASASGPEPGEELTKDQASHGKRVEGRARDVDKLELIYTPLYYSSFHFLCHYPKISLNPKP